MQGNGDEEKVEVAIVSLSDAVSDPRTVMIESLYREQRSNTATSSNPVYSAIPFTYDPPLTQDNPLNAWLCHAYPASTYLTL